MKEEAHSLKGMRGGHHIIKSYLVAVSNFSHLNRVKYEPESGGNFESLLAKV